MRKRSQPSSGKQRSETGSKGSEGSHGSRKRKRPGKSKRRGFHGVRNAKRKSPEERKPGGPERTLSAVGKILSTPGTTSPKALRRSTLARVEMWVAVMGAAMASSRKKSATPRRQERQEEEGRKHVVLFCWCIDSVAFGYAIW